MMRARHLRWSYLSTAVTAALQLVSAITLTRFLQPRDYGLAALALLFANLTAYFTQLGVGRALVQRAVITDGNIRAAFTLAVLTGLAGTLVLYLVAPGIAQVLLDGRLTLVIRVLSVNLLFQALALVAGGLLRRELRMRALALCDAAAYVTSTFCIGLPLAVYGYGVWALVASTVSQSLIQSVCYFAVRPHATGLTFDRSAYRGIAAFSGKASLVTAIEGAGSSLDLALIGRLFGAASTGLYGRSLTLSTQPCYQVSMGLTRVFAPTLAQTMRSRDRAAAVASVVHAERQLMSVIFPVCVSAALCAPSLVPLIFGPQWMTAVPIYRVLCIVAAFDSSFDIPALQLEIANDFKAKLLIQTTSLIVLSAAIILIAPVKGLLGVTIVYACLQVVRSLCFHWISSQSLGVHAGVLLASWIPGIVCSAAIAITLNGVQRLLPAANTQGTIPGVFGLVCCTMLTGLSVYYFGFNKTVFQRWTDVVCGRSLNMNEAEAVAYPKCEACAS